MAPSEALDGGTINAPEKAAWGAILKIGVDSTYEMLAIDCNGKAWVNGYNALSWTGWMRLATATPPQEYDLPLADGITEVHPCIYRKNQFGLVFVGGAASGDITDGVVIATLPVGFCPTKNVERPATFVASSGTRTAGSVVVMTDGRILAYSAGEVTNVIFAADFFATD